MYRLEQQELIRSITAHHRLTDSIQSEETQVITAQHSLTDHSPPEETQVITAQHSRTDHSPPEETQVITAQHSLADQSQPEETQFLTAQYSRTDQSQPEETQLITAQHSLADQSQPEETQFITAQHSHTDHSQLEETQVITAQHSHTDHGPPEEIQVSSEQHSLSGHPQTEEDTLTCMAVGSCSIYANLEVNGRAGVALVDTGSTHCLISTAFAARLGWVASGSADRDRTSSVTLADGQSTVAVQGRLQVGIIIAKHEQVLEVHIVQCKEDMLLGMDFMAANGCTINLERWRLEINGSHTDLVGSNGCKLRASVRVYEEVTVPAHSEAIVKCIMKEKPSDSEGVIQHDECMEAARMGINVARCLVTCPSNREVPVRIFNSGPHPVRLKSGQAMARYVGCSQYLRANKANIEDNDEKVKLETSISRAHLEPMVNQMHESVSQSGKQTVIDILQKYEAVFSKGPDDMGRTGVTEHDIIVKEDIRPIKKAPYRVGPHAQEVIDSQVKALLDRDLIEESQSPWASPVVVVAKKNGAPRFCCDYRALNAVTTVCAYPMPRIDDSLDALTGAVWFSTFDLLSGYWQVPLHESAREKTAFVTRSGLYQWKVMAMGLVGASSTFERLMEQTMKGLQWRTCLLYIDDLICFSKTEAEHATRLEEIFSRLRDAGLKIKVSKSKVMQREVEFLGHVVSSEGVKMDPGKVSAILNMTEPGNAKEVRAVMGMFSYYRQYIPNLSTLAAPLFELMKKNARFDFNHKCRVAFQLLKDEVASDRIMAYPNPERPYILDTDCSGVGMGAVLSQVNESDEERPVAFYSRTLSPAERKYSVTKMEMCAMVAGIRHFHHYLLGRRFTVRVDHHSLIWLRNTKAPTGILARWLETLASFEFDVVHRAGRLHGNADGLSRLNPMESEMRTRRVDGDIDQAEWKRSQEADADLEPVRIWLRQKGSPTKEQRRIMSHRARWYLDHAKECHMKDGMIYHQEGANRSTVVVPEDQQDGLMKGEHERDHAGADRLQARLANGYFWHGMAVDIRLFVSGCWACQQGKGQLKARRGDTLDLEVGNVLDVVSIDVCGPFTRSRNDNTVMLVLVDHFSRWAEAYALPDQRGATCARAIYEGFVQRFGAPIRLHSDNGRGFKNEVMDELCSLMGITRSYTCPYNPTGNALVERMHSTILGGLRAKLARVTEKLEWDELIPEIMAAYRATNHPATGYSPNMMFLGREIEEPGARIRSNEPPWCVQSYVVDLQQRMRTVQQEFRETLSMQEGNRESKKTYEVNDRVWLVPPTKPTKLEPRLLGPYRIVHKLKYNTFTIVPVDALDADPIQVSVNRLRLCQGSAGEIPTRPTQEGNHTREQTPENQREEERDHSPEPIPSTSRGHRLRKAPTWLQDYDCTSSSSTAE